MAQFPGPAGQPGSTAISKNDPSIIGWCNNCVLNRGAQNCAVSGSPLASTGDASAVIGAAQENGVVSLGDGGMATCYFSVAITNGAGYDFAIFENAFNDSYLEFAFVEVSSDGVNFFRFPNQSVQDTLIQIGPYDTCDTKKVNQLAGKYRSGFGTPFDLDLLKGQSGLDVNYIVCVRVVDVIGSIDPKYGQRDSYGHLINDPWPTDFASSGFDLDAVGIMHAIPLGLTNHSSSEIIFPTVVHVNESMFLSPINTRVWLMDTGGRIVAIIENESEPIQLFTPGVYILTDGTHRKKIIAIAN